MQTDIDPRDLIGHKAVDRNGDKIGTVDEVYLDDATGRPEWAAVRTGIFGRDAFVPLTTSEFSGEELRVPYDKSLVKESPDFGVGQHLSPAQELQLYRYYGLDTPADGHPSGEHGEGRDRAAGPDLDFGTAPAAAVAPAAATTIAKPHAFRSPEPAPTDTSTAPEAHVRTLSTPAPAPAVTPAVEPKPHPAPHAAPHPTPAATGTAPTTGTAPAAPAGPVEITCREERLDVTTEWHTVGTAKLRKYVTTEQIERRVPVVRERVRVERMPVSEAERASLTEKDIAEAVEEVTLREERPVVRKYLAPIERVRLVVERYTAEEVIRDELRREHVEVHDDTTPPDAAPAPSTTTPAADTPRPSALRPLV
ncbi:YsnF/AvaK domain-containing protein [Kitasatospora sp. Ki12]